MFYMVKTKLQEHHIIKRPPIVVVMGHIDHGKSTLLDFIRKANVVEGEAGGITQHLSAYVANHTTKEGVTGSITFLDTPGHEAFQKMRLRGADLADVAILVVSAEDGVKPQTMEALASIEAAGIPYVVAINKIDKPGADIPRTQASLIEHGIYIEGMGGNIPWTAISAKAGTGVDDLLDLVVLTADLADLKADTNSPAEGKVIEAKLDKKRGNTATLIISKGTLKTGDFVVSGRAFSPVRIMEDFTGRSLKEASLSVPVGIVGWNETPVVGAPFTTVANKKAAEEVIASKGDEVATEVTKASQLPTIPLLIKADVSGTLEAILHELAKFESDRVSVKIIDSAVGDISVADVQNVSATKSAIIVGFNVRVERSAQDLAERLGVEIDTFKVIYELSEWLNTALKNRTPTKEEEIVTGRAKILRHFSVQRYTHVLGGRAEEGVIKNGQEVRIMRRDIKIGEGEIKNIQQAKSDVSEVKEGEFGMQLQTKTEIAAGDYIEAFDTVTT